MTGMFGEVFQWAPGREGYYRDFGDAFVPEILHERLAELRAAFDDARRDPEFWKSCVEVMLTYSSRPTPVTYCDNLTRRFGGERIYVKREDLNQRQALHLHREGRHRPELPGPVRRRDDAGATASRPAGAGERPRAAA
jgi:hypothetical protein